MRPRRRDLPHAEHVVRHEGHPLLVEDVGSRHVGGDVSSDGVSESGRSVGVELSSLVTGPEKKMDTSSE